MENKKLKPFTKWVGGKTQLLPEIKSLMPSEYDRYFEPFVGGGALFFELLPKKATISDLNTDLILAYKAIKNDVNELLKLLEIHKANNSKEYYLSVREVDRNGKIDLMSDTEKAARILYMLRVDFNGMYRVNSKNQFNVPYGKYKNPRIVNKELLNSISLYLNENDIEVLNTDFQDTVNKATKDDFVYFDPPYAPVSATSAFTSYTQNGFDNEEQVRLSKTFETLTERGVNVMVSNSDVGAIHELYGKLPKTNITVVKASRMINSKATKRGKVNELIIRNYS